MAEDLIAEQATHTPGPWRSGAPDHAAPGVGYVLADIPGRSWPEEIAVIYGAENVHRDANVILIAAAPELLDALKAVWLLLPSVIDPGVQRRLRELAEAAIAKAEGR